MQPIDIDRALPQIAELLELASRGEEIIITKNDHPIVKLIAPDRVNEREIVSAQNFENSLKEALRSAIVSDRRLTPTERTQAWLDFVASLPKTSASLPDEALHRDTMYD